MTKIYSAVVSQVVRVGFADLAQAAEELPGQEFGEGRARLTVDEFVGTGLVAAVRFGGTLRANAALSRPVDVEVVVSPWAVGRSEVAIHPISNLGSFDSLRATRFFKTARSILPMVIDRLYADLPAQAALELAA